MLREAKMIYHKILAAMSAGALVGAIPGPVATSSSARDDVLVTVDWLAEHLEDPDLVLIQVGDDESFPKAHIAGAYAIDFDSFTADGGEGDLALELPDPERLQEHLRRLGVTERSTIVLYQSDEWLTPTARALLTLQWAGLEGQTRVLDGGITAWQAAGRQVTREPPMPREGTIVLDPRTDLIVDAEFVSGLAERAGYSLVDARADQWYSGARTGRNGERGHIPGAVNIDWRLLVDEATMLLKPEAELRAIFREAGVAEGDVVVGYCHVGQYATMMLLAARTLGHEVMLYDGSFQDWSRRGLPTEPPSERSSNEQDG